MRRRPVFGWGVWFANLLIAFLVGLLWKWEPYLGITLMAFVLLNSVDHLHTDILKMKEKL
jgi:hypothetical protein